MSVFRDVTVVAKCFWAFILPVLEYCSPVWMSAATSHLSLLDRFVSQVGRLSSGSVSCENCAVFALFCSVLCSIVEWVA